MPSVVVKFGRYRAVAKGTHIGAPQSRLRAFGTPLSGQAFGSLSGFGLRQAWSDQTPKTGLLGLVFVDKVDVWQQPVEARQKIGYLPDSPLIPPREEVIQHLSL